LLANVFAMGCKVRLTVLEGDSFMRRLDGTVDGRNGIRPVVERADDR
jgi:hypothetical protein